LSLSLSNSLTSLLKDDIEIHSIDTGIGIVLKTKINMFLNTKAEVSSG
jgi:hypothetical protein